MPKINKDCIYPENKILEIKFTFENIRTVISIIKI